MLDKDIIYDSIYTLKYQINFAGLWKILSQTKSAFMGIV